MSDSEPPRKRFGEGWGCFGWFINLGMGALVVLLVVLPVFALVVSVTGSSDGLGKKLVLSVFLIAMPVLVFSLGAIQYLRYSASRKDDRRAGYGRWYRRWQLSAIVSSAVGFVTVMLLADMSALD